MLAISVTPGPRARRRRPLLAMAVALLALGGVALTMARGERRQLAGTQSLREPHSVGPDRIAADYRYPFRCIVMTVAASDPSYVRADLDRASTCARDAAWTSTIFHRVDGTWRTVIVMAGHTCPVHALPQRVQVELGVCPQKHRPRQLVRGNQKRE